MCLAVVVVHAGEPAPIPNEPGEENPGGSATTRDSIDTRDAFSHFSQGIGLEGEAKFKVGNAIFRKLWVSAPSSTTSSDGLGPLYNSRACQSCHLKDGRGHPPAANFPADTAESMFLRLSIPPQNDEQKRLLAEHRVNTINEPTYGEQLQNIAVQGLDNEGQMRIDYQELPVTLADGTVVNLRHPTYSHRWPGVRPTASRDDAVAARRAADDRHGPAGSHSRGADPRPRRSRRQGQRRHLRPHQRGLVDRAEQARARPLRLEGRQATVRQQAASAFAGDMGLSTPVIPNASATARRRSRPASTRPTATPSATAASRSAASCSTSSSSIRRTSPCRRAAMSTTRKSAAARRCSMRSAARAATRPRSPPARSTGQPHLSNQKIWPYTDLLLHDMGEGLADNRPEGVANGREWRTPPLWGIGLTQLVSGHTLFLHDGRARNLEEAILWHGGEAQAARDGYAALSKADREALIKFVESL